MDIWVVHALNQLLIESFYIQIELSKNNAVSGKTPFFNIGPFCNSQFICLNIGF